MLVAVAVALLGAASADAARRAPGFSLPGDSVTRLVLGITAGWAAVVAGLALSADGARGRGALLAAAGCAWLASGFGTPAARGPVLFTLGLVLAAAAPALIGHLVLLGAGDHLPRQDRPLIATLYASLVGVLGLLSTLFFDFRGEGCAACPANLLRVADAPAAAADFSRWGVRLGLLATACTIALAVLRLARAPTARQLRAAPLVVPGCAYLAVVAADLGHAWQRGFLSNDRVDQALWLAQALAILGMAMGAVWLVATARQQRSRLAHVVIELADAQRPGGLRKALAELLGDPELDLLYPAPADDGWIDSTGELRAPPPNAITTPLIRDGRPVALLCHRPEMLDDPRLAAELERGVRLGLDHERLQSQLRRQLEQLRRSRAEVAAAGEAERRSLERDLHDGAQQRLVAFAFALGIAQQHASPQHSQALAQAHRELREALGELRELAHGLYPVALADAGLAAAIESLKDRRPGLRTDALPAGRLPPTTEETAYFTIARLADHWGPEPIAVDAAVDDLQLVVDIRAPAPPPADLVDVEDRVGALGGAVTVHADASDETHVRIELPCA